MVRVVGTAYVTSFCKYNFLQLGSFGALPFPIRYLAGNFGLRFNFRFNSGAAVKISLTTLPGAFQEPEMG